uniref:PDZ domain-containing protein n=1 Tax=Romanomermis culicivorax TaxID=13658 RepID=A0A915KZC4_ROMCU
MHCCPGDFYCPGKPDLLPNGLEATKFLSKAYFEKIDVSYKNFKPQLSPTNTSDQIPAHLNNSSSFENDNIRDQFSAVYDGAASSFNSEIVSQTPLLSRFDRRISGKERLSSFTPKWCRLMKKGLKDDFGFNLIADKKRGYFIGKIDEKSIAEAAGLKENLRLVGVNYHLVDLSVGYKDVVNLILKYPMHVTLMVVTEETHQYYSSNHMNYNFNEAEPLISQGENSGLLKENVEKNKVVESSPIHHQNDYEPATQKKDNQDRYGSATQYRQQMSLNLKEPRRPVTPTRPKSLYAGSANNPNFVLSENFFHMSVAEVRELISKQKKFDPRNNALSLLEKYNINLSNVDRTCTSVLTLRIGGLKMLKYSLPFRTKKLTFRALTPKGTDT